MAVNAVVESAALLFAVDAAPAFTDAAWP